MVHSRKILTLEVKSNERFFIVKYFSFLISATFLKNDCSTTYVQKAPKKFRPLVNSVMSTGIKKMFGQCVYIFRVSDFFKSTVDTNSTRYHISFYSMECDQIDTSGAIYHKEHFCHENKILTYNWQRLENHAQTQKYSSPV